MATIKEIAKKCGVSAATVSNILNGKPGASEATRALVLKTAQSMEYMPSYVAKSLKTKNTRSIGVIAEDMTIFSIPDIIDGITEYCEKINYNILLINLRLYKKYEDTYYNNDNYFGTVVREIKELMARQVEGIIYVTAHERNLRCIPEDLPIPAVMAYGYSCSKKIPSIVVDDDEGTYNLVRYLIEMGHRRIGVLTGKMFSLHVQSRLLGYQKALRDYGLTYDPEIVLTANWSRETAYAYTDFFLKKKVSAVFCMNDIMAAGVYDRADELGIRIPEDLSVVGYDNRELSSYFKPPLTTVELPLHDVGYRAAEVMMELLARKIETGDKELIYQVPCKQLIRQSVGNIGKIEKN